MTHANPLADLPEDYFRPDLSAFDYVPELTRAERDPAPSAPGIAEGSLRARAVNSIAGKRDLINRPVTFSRTMDRLESARAAARAEEKRTNLFADGPDQRSITRRAVVPVPPAPAIKPGSLRAKALASRKGAPPLRIERTSAGSLYKPHQSTAAKKTVLQDTHPSPSERKGGLRMDCKERPEGHKVDTKHKGSGTKHRTFIPWCDEAHGKKKH